MKRQKLFLTTLLAGLLMSGNVWGETVSNPAALDRTKAYMLTTKRGSVIWDGSSETLSTTSSVSSENSNHLFVFVPAGGNNTYFLFNVGAQKYVKQNNKTARLYQNEVEAWKVKTSGDSDYPLMIDASSGNHWNISGGNILIDGWSTADDGNKFAISEARDITTEELTAAVSQYTLFTKPAFGGTVWTWNTSTNMFDADGQTSTATPSRADNKGPVYTFNSVGTVTTSVNQNTDTSDQGGINITGTSDNPSNVTSKIGRWAGSIEVDQYCIADIFYSAQLKGTESGGCATVWVDGQLSITGRTDFSMNDGGNQCWFIGEHGNITTGFTSVTKGNSRRWDIQVVVADDEKKKGITQKSQTTSRKVLTWGSDISSNINSIQVFKKDGDTYTPLTGENVITYDATGITVHYTAMVNQPTIEYNFTDNAGNQYTGTYEGTQGDFPTFTGINSVSYTDVTWGTNGDNLTVAATIVFPFKVSKEDGVTKYVHIASFNDNNFYWAAEETDIVVTKGTTIPTDDKASNFEWAIYPKLTGTAFSFQIKNIGTSKYVYTTSTSNSHSQGTVTLSETATDFTHETNNQWKYGNVYLSLNSSNTTSKQYVGTWTSHSGTKTKITDVEYTITYQITKNEKVVWSQAISVEKGNHYPVPTSPNEYVTLSGYPTTGTVTKNETIELTYTQTYPFTISSSYGDATWYTLTLHSSDKYYLYNPGDATSMTLDRKYTTFCDNDMWCFVGDYFEGIKLYNKGKGNGYVLSASKTMSTNDGETTYPLLKEESTIDESANNKSWDVISSPHATNGFYLAQHGTTYKMNRRGTNLAFWTTGADGGSTFLVNLYEEQEYTINAIDQHNNTVTGGGVVFNGQNYTSNLTTGKGLLPGAMTGIDVANYIFDKIIVDGTAITVHYIAWTAETDQFKGKVWQLKVPNKGTNAIAYENSNHQLNWTTDEDKSTDKSSMWYIELVNNEHKYLLRNVKTGRYMKYKTANYQVWEGVIEKEDENNTTLYIHELGTPEGKSTLYAISYNSTFEYKVLGCMHADGSNNIVRWSCDALEGASSWTITEVTTHGITDWTSHWAHCDAVNKIESLQGKTKIGASTEEGVTIMYPNELEYTPTQIDAAIDAVNAINTETATTAQMEEAYNTNAAIINNYTTVIDAYGNLAKVDYTLSAEYGTIMLPSNVGKPDNLTIYSCASATNGVLNLESTGSFIKNTPYILSGTSGSKYQFIGYDKSSECSEGTKTVGLLTGTLNEISASDINSIEGKVDGRVYVLRNQNSKLGFYQLDPETDYKTLSIGANRCYLTLEASENVKAFYFDEDDVPTMIESLNENLTDNKTIYNLAGQKVNTLQKGINIVNGKKVLY